jgi:glucose/arabinose dehydrogenase
MSRKVTLVFGVATILVFGLYIFRNRIEKIFFTSTISNVPEGVTTKDIIKTPASNDKENPDIEVIAENLDIPWEIAFLPTGEMLVTERPGTLLKIGENREVVEEISGVEHVGEGGLMGLALHPNFLENNYIYLYLTSRDESGLINRVESYKLQGNSLSDKKLILKGIKGAQYHDGGRIKFGPDGKLYITTGDAGDTSLAQDTSSLNGKILRINPDGSIPEDNPFGNEVYSYGHRNPQGLVWDNEGRLWATEHGPSGLQSGYDELNLIEKGSNYGWPDIRGDERKEGMKIPVIQSGADDTWAPAGAAFVDGSIFFAGLRGSSLYEASLNGTKVSNLLAHFRGEYGRLRAVVKGPDGFLYITTSNTDGRGSVNDGDDKIIRVNPNIFK